MSLKTWFVPIACVCLCGCNQFAADKKDLQVFRQDVIRLNNTCDRLAKQMEELTKVTADLKAQVALLQDTRKELTARPVRTPAPPTGASAEQQQIGEPQAAPGLCDIVETHIAAVEGLLSQSDPDSMGSLLDDLAAAFNANLRAFAQHPRIKQIQAAASAMRDEYLAAAKQSHLATNPYLKHVRQKSLNEARQAARKLRSLCED